MSDGNVRPYRRQPLEPEIAAISLHDSGETPIIVVNVDERRTRALAALKKLRPHVLIPAAFGAMIERIVHTIREHTTATILIGSTAASTVVITPMALNWDNSEQKLGKPPSAMRVVTLPPPPAVTRTVTAKATPVRPLPTRTRPATAERVTRQPLSQRPPVPTASSSRPVTSEPSRRPRPPSPRPSPPPTSPPTPDRSAGSSPSQTQPAPRSDASPAETQDPPSPPSQEPTTTPETPASDCVVRVDLDPLLDLCVLG